VFLVNSDLASGVALPCVDICTIPGQFMLIETGAALPGPCILTGFVTPTPALNAARQRTLWVEE